MESHAPRGCPLTCSAAEAAHLHILLGQSEDGLSAVEYARANGLAIDSREQFVESRLAHGIPFGQCAPGESPDSLIDDSHLPQFPIPDSPLPFPNEVPAVTQPSLELLRWVSTFSKEGATVAFQQPTYFKTPRLKLELPLLPLDTEPNYHELALFKNLSSTSEPDMVIPREPLNEGNGEGLSFPTGALRFTKTLDDVCRNERFDLSKESVKYLTTQLHYLSKTSLETATFPSLSYGVCLSIVS